MKKDFKLEISSDLNYNGMVVHISYRNDLLAVLNQDKGSKNIEIKMFPSKDQDYWIFPYEELLNYLNKAKDVVIKINQQDQ